MGQNIFFKWLIFQFFEAPKEILKAWRNFLIFNLNYFSIPVLTRTLFAYFRKYSWDYPKGFDLAKYLEVAASNFISRILGALMRVILIFIGIIIEIFILFLGGAVFLIWLILPVFIIFCLYHGCRILL
ncbi:MAG: hypothetical protein ABH813_03315 [Patescibacteria group bacterium]